AIFIFENILVHDVVQQITALIIMNAKTLLLNKSIVTSGIYLKTGGQCYGSQGAMRSDCHVKGFGHGEYLLAFCNSTRMREIRLNDVVMIDGQELLKLTLRKQPFTCRVRYVDMLYNVH